MELVTVKMNLPEGSNLILGQAHFIKTVEDLYEALVTSAPGLKFGIAFNEASGACLTRVEGNDDELKGAAARNAQDLGAGHIFVVLLREGYPINVLNRVKEVQEVVGIYCATANPVEVIVAVTEQGRGILGVIDGASPLGVEGEDGVAWRRSLLRTIGYKK
jgi:adenosine/AMP kinase